MKVQTTLLSVALAASALANPTISDTDKFAHGANFGPINCRPISSEGISVGDYYLNGRAYSANVGWISFGTSIPADGIRWSSSTGSDAGVNHDGSGTLTGMAYGANIGWISFEQTRGEPSIDLQTGQFSGYAYSANAGWINLSGVQTDRLAIIDSDGDGIDDPWELDKGAPDLTEIDATSDQDGDGSSDLDEYLADTDPYDSRDYLRILQISLRSSTEALIIWTSKPSRQYLIESSEDLTLWQDDGTVYDADLEDDVTGAALTIDLSLTPRMQFRVKPYRTLTPK